MLDGLRQRIVDHAQPQLGALSKYWEQSRTEQRRRFFAGREGNRYWWHRRINDAYLPEIYDLLSDQEWQTLRDWYVTTDKRNLVGECQVPPMAWLCSFVSANNVSRMVQLGTCAGYSTLLLGWTMRRMNKQASLMAVDISEEMCGFTGEWLHRAGLDAQVRLEVSDSASPELPARAARYLGGAPQIVFIDSSHQYEHTLVELELWFNALAPGGLMVLHDTSEFAATFDSTGKGGVHRALTEWNERRGAGAFSLALPQSMLDAGMMTYMDGCGLGLILKSSPSAG